MVDDVKDITETAESKASQEVLDRARLARERREAEQRKRLDELRAHAAAAQAQREKRDEDRRKRQAEQRARDDDRRVQVEERKRAIWEASVSRREALLQRERDRSERLERQRAARSAPRPAFAFGSSTPRLLEPLDSGGFFWAARRAASTTNVMFASAPLTRRASALQLDSSDTDNKDEPDRHQLPAMWSSVARRRTDLVPTLPAPRAPGRAYSMTRLDRLPHSPAMHHSRTQTRSGETTPSRPGSALSTAGVQRRPATAPRKPRPASIAGTGVNTPRGGIGDVMSQSAATTPTVSRDSTVVGAHSVPRRPASTPRRPRPASIHATTKPATPAAPGEGKPPLHRKPKPSKENDRTPRGKSASASPGRGLSPSPPPAHRAASREVDSHKTSNGTGEKQPVSAAEVSHKLEALQIQNGDHASEKMTIDTQPAEQRETKSEVKPIEQDKSESNTTDNTEQAKPNKTETIETEEKLKPVESREEKIDRVEEKAEKREEKKEPSQEKTDDSEMTASMSARRITTEEEAKAALAERRRRAREELERQAELERQRLQREAEEEAERQRVEREREVREEQEARELARLQRTMEEEKLQKAIEAQQQLEREEAERKAREEADRQAKLKEDEEKRKAAEEAEKLRKEEAEREEKERLARKQRVEAIMARTRLRKAEEDKKQQDSKQPLPSQAEPAPSAEPAGNGKPDNGNVATEDLLGFTTQPEAPAAAVAPAKVEDGSGDAPHNNGNLTGDLLQLSQQTISEDKTVEQPSTKATTIDNTTLPTETNNGNHTDNQTSNQSTNMSANLSANFIQNEIASNESQKLEQHLLDEDFTTHNGHGTLNHPLTLQNAI